MFGAILGAWLCRVQQRQIITLKSETKIKRAEKSHYQSEVFVCLSTNCADAVDRLSMLMFKLMHRKESRANLAILYMLYRAILDATTHDC